MIDQIFILSQRGETLVYRDFKCSEADNSSVVENFWETLKESKQDQASPVNKAKNKFYVHIKRNGLYIACTTLEDHSPFLLLEMLNRVCTLLKDSCGTFTEEAIRLNFKLVLELLEEILAFGYPQDLSSDHLKLTILNDPLELKSSKNAADLFTGLFGLDRSIPSNASEKSVLAPSDQLIKKFEIYVDVIEKLTVLLSPNGKVVHSDIEGSIQLKSFLGGIPDIKIGLNENLVTGKPELDSGASFNLNEVFFHQSVNVDEFEQSRVITASPPDGEFTLMRYHMSGPLPSGLPFQFIPSIKLNEENREIAIVVKLRCDLPQNSESVNATVRIPVPRNTMQVYPSVPMGQEQPEYLKHEKIIKWKMEKLQGGSEMTAKFLVKVADLTQATRMEMNWLCLEFELPHHVCSGLQIKSMHIFDRTRSYVPHRFVRYVTHSDSYVMRL